MQETDWVQVFATFATVIGTAVTAVATVFLWRVTRTLAVETKRMADVSAQPQVIATVRPNMWAMIYADLIVENAGNATAFDIEVVFDPPLKREVEEQDEPIPFKTISILNPGQSLLSYLSNYSEIIDTSFQVTVSWRKSPTDKTRETLTYSLNMAEVKGVSQLGKSDPMIQIAEQLKKLREDWTPVSKGQRKLKSDIYDSDDRAAERQANEERHAQMQRRMEAQKAQTIAPSTSSEPPPAPLEQP